jgi:hypothetical protein
MIEFVSVMAILMVILMAATLLNIKTSKKEVKEDITAYIAASEERTTESIAASEERTTESIEASEERTTESITAFVEDVQQMYHIWFSSKNMTDLNAALTNFNEHLVSLAEMEMYYQDSTLKELLTHSQGIIEQVEQFKANVESVREQNDEDGE